MNVSDMRFPRQLEVDDTAETIRRLLMAHTTKLWPEGRLDIPVIRLSATLKTALGKARLQGRVRLGYEDIFEKLAGEKRGISLIKQKTIAPYPATERPGLPRHPPGKLNSAPGDKCVLQSAGCRVIERSQRLLQPKGHLRPEVLHGNRISRLLFFSNDGAERFYRHIEQTLLEHTPRLLGCLLDIDGSALGHLITGKSGIIKIIMIDHKDAVSDVLNALITENDGTGK